MAASATTTVVADGPDYDKKQCISVGNDELSVTPLGAGCEVGRSCILVKFRGRTVMFDCGIHPAHSGIGALPLFDAVDVSETDLCLVTHFHLDHCGALPHFVAKTSFNGRVVSLLPVEEVQWWWGQVMTEPTRAIAKLLWVDYASMARVSTVTAIEGAASEYADSSSSALLFDLRDVERTMEAIETIDFRQTIDYRDLGISVTAYAAGHVCGACMFCVDFGGVRVLYTGDYSREVDRHLPVAEIPKQPIDVLICESTYGIRMHEPRAPRERRFLDAVAAIVLGRRGKCLLPVFALGRAQEILLMLDEYWASRPALHKVPIWYASPMSARSMVVFESFLSHCGDLAQKVAETGENPFQLRFVKTARRLDDMRSDVYREGPCVVMASPGMLQSGTSRLLFEAWCRDKRNGVILTGYACWLLTRPSAATIVRYALKGTLADDLKRSPATVRLSRDGPPLPVQSSFEMISFSAHSDFNQSFEFIQRLQCPNVVLVHGERNEMTGLRNKLKELRPALAVFCPEVLQRVALSIPRSPAGLCLGSLATTVEKGALLRPQPALMVIGSDPQDRPIFVAPEESQKLLDIPVLSIDQTLLLWWPWTSLDPLVGPLRRMFERVDVSSRDLCVERRVHVDLTENRNELRLAWESDPLADLLGDCVVLVVQALVRNATAPEAPTSPDNTAAMKEQERRDTGQGLGRQSTLGSLETDYLQCAASSAVTEAAASPGFQVSSSDAVWDKVEEEILDVVVTALSQKFEKVGVCKDESSGDTYINVETYETDTGARIEICVNFTKREVSCVASPEEAAKLRKLLQRLERPLLPLPALVVSS